MKTNEEWSSQLWTQFMQLHIKKTKKNSGHQRGWTHGLAILVRCSNQLRAMKPLMLGAGQLFVFICSCERDECDRCNYMKIIKNCGNEIKWRMILAVVKAPEKKKERSLIYFIYIYHKKEFIKKINEWAKVSRQCGTYGLGLKPSGSRVTNINSNVTTT